jgi:hypothetical protein
MTQKKMLREMLASLDLLRQGQSAKVTYSANQPNQNTAKDRWCKKKMSREMLA